MTPNEDTLLYEGCSSIHMQSEIRGKIQRNDGHKTAMWVIYAGKATSLSGSRHNEKRIGKKM